MIEKPNQFRELMSTAIQTVRDYSPNTKIIIHFAGQSNGGERERIIRTQNFFRSNLKMLNNAKIAAQLMVFEGLDKMHTLVINAWSAALNV